MPKEIYIVKNKFTGTFILDPHRDRKEFPDWPSVKKVIVEGVKEKRKVELYTNLEAELIEELKKELRIVQVKEVA